MSELAIRVEGLGKRYRIRHERRERYTALRDVLAHRLRGLVSPRTRGSARRASSEDFWALSNVSFDVRRGEVLGIIGRNGAGKSTLLKILSRITEPSEGRVELHGRVASLLEVGTGFHPELTGRENIYLNGAILGMSRVEIRRKFDEIVRFAEVEPFLDLPVKRYSSGMYVRLAFAVAAHMEPEILIVDEVLAVGDAEFQKKCLGRISQVAHGGRTVLFVSHNMAAITALCHRALLLDGGRVHADGPPEALVRGYLGDRRRRRHVAARLSPGVPQFRSIALVSETCRYGDCLELDLELVSPVNASAGIEIEIHDHAGAPVIYASTAPMYGELVSLSAGEAKRIRLTLGPLPLASGDYFLRFWLIKPWTENYHVFPEPLLFSIVTSDPGSCGFEFRQDYHRGAVTVPIQVCETPSEVALT